ncbi:MAG: hypothetical protein L6R40_000116 [Gallowayella cf. fulva]|nr:MAG: hypothetical protein L6R40_000116 [Xanthomendoza cf. fulva]
MPAPAGTKRVKGISIYRPFIFGSIATPIDPANRPANINADHTHRWTIYVRPCNPHPDLSYFIKKISFKLHETYTNSLRTVEAPPFEVTETGWGEFEVQIKLYFIPEANEKPQTIWHHLKLHPYGEHAERQRERKEPVVSECYEEVVFNEPVEAFYDLLTSSGGHAGRGKGSKGSKQASMGGKKGPPGERVAELPFDGVYSQKEEGRELDRLGQAIKTVEMMVKEERKKLEEREKTLADLNAEDGAVVKAR